MPFSFLATIAFAILVIAGSFIANLVVLVFSNSQWHVSGVIAAIVGAAASYWAQHHFTAAEYARDTLRASQVSQIATAANQATTEAISRAESFGVLFQYVAIAFIVASVVCFWMGLR